MKTNRNELIDALKGITILLVIVGHVIQFGQGKLYLSEKLYFDNWLFKVIYSFHMPLFIGISGYLFYYSVKKYSFKELLKRKCLTILLPITSFYTINLINRAMILHESISFSFKSLINDYCSFLWYLWALLYCMILTVFFVKLLKDRWWTYLILLSSTFLLPENRIFGGGLYKFMLFFFVLGYLFNKYGLTIGKQVLLFWGVFIGYVVLLLMYNRQTFIYISGMSLWNGDSVILQVIMNFHRIGIAILGIICFIHIIKRMSIWIGLVPFKIIGRHTLGVYASHMMIISLLTYIHVLPCPFYDELAVSIIWNMIVCLVVYLSAFGISFMLSKNKYTNVLFLGTI